MKGGLAETENSPSEWEERQKSRADELGSRSLLRGVTSTADEEAPVACDSTGGRAHNPTEATTAAAHALFTVAVVEFVQLGHQSWSDDKWLPSSSSHRKEH